MPFSQQLCAHVRILGNTVKWTHLFTKSINKDKKIESKIGKVEYTWTLLKTWCFISFCLDYVIWIRMWKVSMLISFWILPYFWSLWHRRGAGMVEDWNNLCELEYLKGNMTGMIKLWVIWRRLNRNQLKFQYKVCEAPKEVISRFKGHTPKRMLQAL